MRRVTRFGSSAAGVDSSRAWTIAAMGSTLNTWAFGVFYSFGAAFSDMADDFGAGKGATAAVFAITTFLYFGGGLVAGPLSDRFGPRPLLAFGTVSMSLGLILTAQVESVVVGYVTYGLGVGLGIAAYLVPLTATVSGWFERRRSLALGVHTGGIGLGTLLLVPAVKWLISSEGWRDAFRLLGFGTVIVYGLATAVISRPPAAASGSRRPVGQVLKTASFIQMYTAGLFMTSALFVPFVFIVDYSESFGTSERAAVFLISIIGIGSVLGRLGLGALGLRYTTAGVAFACFAVQPFGYAIWLLADGSYPLVALFAAVLGVAYGGYVALSPVLAAELYGVEGLGAILGVLFTSAGVGGLIGPIVAGYVLDQTDSYSVVITMAIVVTAIGALAFAPLRTSNRSGSRRQDDGGEQWQPAPRAEAGHR